MLLFLGTAVLGAISASAQYVMVTPDASINPDGWAMSSTYMTPYVNAITNPANFGPSGTVPVSITLNQVPAVDASTLTGASGFVEAWWNNSYSAGSQAAIMGAFQNGMDLWLFEDDTSHNGLGAALGITQMPASNLPSNGDAPFFTGPFGTASNIAVNGLYSYFDDTNIASLHGTIFMRNGAGQATGVYWAKGAYAPGSGAIILIGDIDMLSSQTANYSLLNDNAIFSLNLTAAMVQAVPEPSVFVLTGVGGLLLLAIRRRKAV